jgi:hypothetical protein
MTQKNKPLGKRVADDQGGRKENKAIKALKDVSKIWPESLWLFSWSGTLCVMKKKNGKRVVPVRDRDIVTIIDIENDGGDI